MSDTTATDSRQPHREVIDSAIAEMAQINAHPDPDDEMLAAFDEAKRAVEVAEAAIDRIDEQEAIADRHRVESRNEAIGADIADSTGRSVDEEQDIRRRTLTARHKQMFGIAFDDEAEALLVTRGAFDSDPATRPPQRALTAGGNDDAGGYLVEGIEVEPLLINYLTDWSIQQLVQLQTVPAGRQREWSVINDQEQTGENLAEGAAASSSDPATGQIKVNVGRKSSKIVELTDELLQDSPWMVQSAIEGLLVRRILRLVDIQIITGTTAGNNQVIGLPSAAAWAVSVDGASMQQVASDATKASENFLVTEATIRKMYNALAPEFAMASSTRWLAKADTLDQIYTLEDGNGNRLFRGRDLSSAAFPPIRGIPVVRNEHLAFAKNKIGGFFVANLASYALRYVRQMRFDVFRGEKQYASAMKQGFMMQQRAGGIWAGLGKEGVALKAGNQ